MTDKIPTQPPNNKYFIGLRLNTPYLYWKIQSILDFSGVDLLGLVAIFHANSVTEDSA